MEDKVNKQKQVKEIKFIQGQLHKSLQHSDVKSEESSLISASSKFELTGTGKSTGKLTENKESCTTASRSIFPQHPRLSSSTKEKVHQDSVSQGSNSTNSGPKRHYNPRVADALDKMVNMGFTDDDGWLTQLLVMKHGDISQVLDILTPVKK